MNSGKRNFNEELIDNEGRKYHYNFDFDIMHPFMIRSFEPFFKPGSCLELGSHEGDFTKRLLAHFDGTNISCIEASSDALKKAKSKLGPDVRFHNSTFEEVQLAEKYDTIVMTHVLEHISDPVSVLQRIGDEWLADDGVFLLVCPNANAPSRQIAVKMGLINYNAAVSESESLHGHFVTYSLDTLERDVVDSGLQVIHRSGIFFKALANFQWDKILKTDIVSREYLEGCYKLGQIYPDLCSSIFLACRKIK